MSQNQSRYATHISDELHVTSHPSAPKTWTVKGHRDRQTHTVIHRTSSPGTPIESWLCTCRMARYEGDCKHIRAVTAFKS